MDWYIPNLEPYLVYFIKEIARWIGDNQQTVYTIILILGWLKLKALKTKNVIDDKIISLLVYFFTFKWFFNLKSGIKEDNNVKLLNE